jgi:hypothetical protein
MSLLIYLSYGILLKLILDLEGFEENLNTSDFDELFQLLHEHPLALVQNAEAEIYGDEDEQSPTTTVSTGESEVECCNRPKTVLPKNVLKKKRKSIQLDNENVSTSNVHETGEVNAAGVEVEELLTKSRQELIPMGTVVRTDYSQLAPTLFCNSINSGDFHQLQGFFNTYVSKQGQYMTSHDVPSVFGLPKPGLLVGPLMMVHYFVGWFVMYPDLTVKVSNFRITPNVNKFGRDKGTVTVTVDMEIQATKLLDIPVGAWLPSTEKLQLLYSQKSLQDIIETIQPNGNSDENTDRSNKSSSFVGPAALPPTPPKVPRRSKPSKPASISTAGGSSNKAAKSSPVAVYGGEFSLRDSHIPESYINLLHGGATMLRTPQRMHSRGILRMQLDENNQIESVNSSMAQLAL